MEDVLDVYCRPYDPTVPQICMDEMGKNLVKDKYLPEPAKPGQVAREDYSYEKEGRANLFIAYEPLAGKRCLKVTERRQIAGLGAVHARGPRRAVPRSQQGSGRDGQPQYAHTRFVL